MKIFTASFRGVCMGGEAVIVAKDRRTARRKLRKELDFQELLEKNASGGIDLEELATDVECVHILSNGDY